MLRTVRRAALVVTVSVALAACATTAFHSTWRNPAAQPLDLEGKKVAALVLMDDTALRYAAEDALAREITTHGGVGVPAYTLIPRELLGDVEKARELLDEAEVEGVVAMRLVGVERGLRASRGTQWGTPRYSSLWGPGFWGWGWEGAYESGSVRVDTIFIVETLVYSLSQNMLVWASESQTTNPTRVEPFMRELGKKVAEEMKKQGLLG